jgi:hypothetical protein
MAKYIHKNQLIRYVKNAKTYCKHNGELYQRVSEKELELRLLNQEWPTGVSVSTIMAKNLARELLRLVPPIKEHDHAD